MKNLFLCFLAFCLTTSLFAQRYDDFGISVGGANYLGDIGGDDQTRRDFVWDMKMEQTSLAFGAFYRKQVTNNIGVKAALNYGRLQGDDALSSNPGRRGRNLNFRNDIIELTARAEYYFYEDYDVGGYGRYLVEFKPYVFGGVGGLYSNPKAELDGEYHALRPLETEGVSYSPITFTMPAGVGFFFTFAKKYRLGWEIGYRHTFSDYLDDVSNTYADNSSFDTDLAQTLANRRPELGNQAELPDGANYEPGEKRGDATHNDAYLFSEFSFSYAMRKGPYRPIWIGGGDGKFKGVRTVRYKSKYGNGRRSF